MNDKLGTELPKEISAEQRMAVKAHQEQVWECEKCGEKFARKDGYEHADYMRHCSSHSDWRSSSLKFIGLAALAILLLWLAGGSR